MADPIDYEGFLKKRKGVKESKGSDKASLSTRWVILRDGSLHIYKKYNNTQPKRSMDLADLELDVSVPNKQNQFCFALKKDKFYCLFIASDETSYNQWTASIRANLKKPKSAPPAREKKKSPTAMAKLKSNMGGKAAASGAGKNMINKMMTEDTKVIIDNLKSFVTKASGEKYSEELYGRILKLLAKITLLCESQALTSEAFWTVTASAIRSIFSKLIDSLELSFSFDPENLASEIRTVEVLCEKVFNPVLSTNSIEHMKEIFDYFASEDILEKFYTDKKYEQECTAIVKMLRKLWNNINFPEGMKVEKI